MIIACSACSARFRIADEKVGPQGARVRCSRCGHLFTVRPPEPVPAPPPAFGLAAQQAEREPTGTGGWPTGALDLDGTPSVDPPSSAGQSLSADPFAAFAGIAAGAPATPVAPETPSPVAAVPPAPPGPEPTPVFTVGDPGQDLGGLPVTDLSALERTGAVPIPAPLPPEPTPATGADLALEDRTPQGGSIRGAGAAWSRPEATQAVAVGPDGFQEVDLREASPSEPGFDALETGATQETALPPPAPTPTPRPAASAAAPSPAATPGQPGVPSSASQTPPAAVVAIEATEGRRLQPARVRAAAMNVLSLAALLLVTVGIVAWWRGDSPAAVLRWPWSRPAGAVEVTQVSSGVYEGPRGMPVLFVRGAVRAGDAPVTGPVAVRVALSRGGRPIATAVAPAGAVPSPEDVAVVASPEDLGRLTASMQARAPTRLEARAEAPFLVLLPAPDGDVGTLRFRVETQAPGVR
ncbi:MAG TPA: zinc-ribbon domain-containing protein [Anaeromyxobacteraceae bacterium]|nr:zinc-ribbon domain-containing protein [Anaeromyxobacteraceae bacterium]